MTEILQAVTDEIGSDKVGLRLSPLNSFNSMKDSDPVSWMAFLAKHLNPFNLAYLHVMRADFFGLQQADILPVAREHFKGHLMVNMGYTAQEAADVIEQGLADSVAFGTGFLANPDLPARIQAGAELNTPDQDTFYTSDEKATPITRL